MKKTISGKPFGHSALKKLKIGDLVYWPSLEVDENNKWFEKRTQGVLTEVVVEFVGGRDVYFGVVIPVKNQISCNVFLYLLEKVTI